MTETATPTEPETTKDKKRFSFPSAYTVLFLVLVLVWVVAFFVPAGRYKTDDAGQPIAGSYHRVTDDLSFGERVRDLFLAPINGLYGVQSEKTGAVGPDETGELYGSAAVFLFVLAIGAFITVVISTGALDRGIGRLAFRLRDRGALLVIAVMAVLSVGGTVEGMAEETLGFYGVIVPLMLALGYDRLVAAAAIILGAGIGTLASTINPFATGVASGAADISIGDGIVLRLAMYVVLTAITIVYVVRYARRVKTDPGRSLVGFLDSDKEASKAAQTEPEPMTGRHKLVLGFTGLAFAFMIFAIVPWASIIDGPDATPYSWELDWYFPELAAMFLVAAVIAGIVGGFGEQKLTDRIISGAGDFIGAALIIVLARGVAVIMNNAQITDTVLHSLEDVVDGTSSGVFAIAIFIVNIPLAILIPSTSGHATLTMPILAPLADFANVDRSLVITAWQSASGITNLITPTTAVIMGGLVMAKVGYDRYFRFVLPLLGILFVAICAFLVLGAAMG